jgi:esterase/lipase superfamily enzyme
MLDDSTSLATIAQAQSPELLTPYQRACLASTEDVPLSASVDLYYATSRRPVLRPDPARDLWFGTERESVVNDRIHVNYGQATVNVPCERERGALPRPETVFIFQREPLDPKKHFHLRAVTSIADEAGWLAAIDGAVAPTRRREVLVYVHGYNNGFADAAYRAGQLHADLGIDGATVFYSWASRERLLGYGRDRETVESKAEIRALADTLASLRNSDATTVYLVAHSMGNRLMMAALDELSDGPDRPARRFNELVLGSADIEQDLFERHWARARTLVDRATLYASSQDKAMWGARMFAGDRRIGDAAPQPLVFDGVRTIDTTGVGGSGLGHDDYSAGGLANVQASVWFGLRPEARCILEPSAGPAGATWWSIRPDDTTEQSDCTHHSFSDAVEVARLRGSFSEAVEWMNQLYPPSANQPGEVSYAGRIRRVFNRLLGRR